jgi:hypothetical protein
VAQLVGNVALELARTVHLAVERLGLADVALAFARSPELHDALREDRSLPLAFGAFLRRRVDDAAPAGDPTHAILALELEMARARRRSVPDAPPTPPAAPGEVVLAPAASLLEVPAGTLDFAAELGAAAEAGRPAPVAPVAPAAPGSLGSPETAAPAAREVLLLLSRPPASGRRTGLREVEVERLSGPAAALLAAARCPLSREARAALARDHGADPAELEAFVATLTTDGILN